VLWCLTPLSTIFQLYDSGQFNSGGNQSTMRKQPTRRRLLSQTLPHKVVSSNLAMNGIRTYNFSGDRH